jgi:hypothetical protein
MYYDDGWDQNERTRQNAKIDTTATWIEGMECGVCMISGENIISLTRDNIV